MLVFDGDNKGHLLLVFLLHLLRQQQCRIFFRRLRTVLVDHLLVKKQLLRVLALLLVLTLALRYLLTLFLELLLQILYLLPQACYRFVLLVLAGRLLLFKHFHVALQLLYLGILLSIFHSKLFDLCF